MIDLSDRPWGETKEDSSMKKLYDKIKDKTPEQALEILDEEYDFSAKVQKYHEIYELEEACKKCRESEEFQKHLKGKKR